MEKTFIFLFLFVGIVGSAIAQPYGHGNIWTKSGTQISYTNGQIIIGIGSATAPSIAKNGATTNGFYFNGDDPSFARYGSLTASFLSAGRLMLAKNNGLTGFYESSAGAKYMLLSDNSSSVNYFNISNAATGAAPDLAANGTDTNIDIDLTPKGTGAVVLNGRGRLKSYTVATLPAGIQGDIAFVTDATAPTFLATVVGGGGVITPVFYDGTNWVAF